MGQKDEVRRIIIGAPLLLVAVFCFGFFMVHSTTSSGVGSAASTSAVVTHKKTPAGTASPSMLAPLPMAKTDLSTLPEAPAADSSTASPQSASDSSSINTGAGAGTFTLRMDSETSKGNLRAILGGTSPRESR